MTPDHTLFGLPYTEILALIGIVSFVVGTAGGLFLLWLSPKFVKKTAYFYDRKELMLELNALADRVTKIEQAMELAKQPMGTMQKAVEDMKDQLEKLTEGIAGLKDSVTEGLHGLDKRATALESKRGLS